MGRRSHIRGMDAFAAEFARAARAVPALDELGQQVVPAPISVATGEDERFLDRILPRGWVTQGDTGVAISVTIVKCGAQGAG